MYRSDNACELLSYFLSQFARQFIYDELYIGNPCRALAHKGNIVDGARAWRHFIMASTGTSFQMPTKDPSLLMTLAFSQWCNESNTTELKYNLYYTGFVCIHRCYAEAAAKSNNSKSAGFEEYLENLPNLRQPEEEVSSSKDEESDEEPKYEAAPTKVQFVGEDESDAPKGILRRILGAPYYLKEKARVDDSEDKLLQPLFLKMCPQLPSEMHHKLLVVLLLLCHIQFFYHRLRWLKLLLFHHHHGQG